MCSPTAVFGQSEPVVSRRQRSNHTTQTTKSLFCSKAQKGTMTPLSLALILLIAVAIHLNGSDKHNEIRNAMIAGGKAL
jgi:hypothetical protein